MGMHDKESSDFCYAFYRQSHLVNSAVFGERLRILPFPEKPMLFSSSSRQNVTVTRPLRLVQMGTL